MVRIGRPWYRGVLGYSRVFSAITGVFSAIPCPGPSGALETKDSGLGRD